jgi:hypothetical protein
MGNPISHSTHAGFNLPPTAAFRRFSESCTVGVGHRPVLAISVRLFTPPHRVVLACLFGISLTCGVGNKNP